MGKKSKPKTPDVVGAAEVEGQMSENQARQTTYADRPDQYNPFGSLTYGQEAYIDPATGQRVTKWTQGQGLSPDMQQNFDTTMGNLQTSGRMSTNAMNRARGEMAGTPNWAQFGKGEKGPRSRGMMGGRVNPTTGNQAFDWDSQNRQRAEDASYGRATSRLDPQFNQERERLEIQMRNQGLRAGDQAYESEMDRFNRSKGDAYEQARLGSVGEGRAEDQQSYGQAEGAYNTNLGSQQQQFTQGLGSAENLRAADQQNWNQRAQGTQEANALRDKNIQEYLQKRQFSLGEAQALDPTSGLQNMTGVYGGGGGG